MTVIAAGSVMKLPSCEPMNRAANKNAAEGGKGINAAKAAGCYNVGIGTANVSHADMVLRDGLANVTVQQVLTYLQAHHSNHE